MAADNNNTTTMASSAAASSTQPEINANNCESDPNFAVICAFFEKFANVSGSVHQNFDIAELQNWLENPLQVSQALIDLHIKLLRRLRKSVKVERWEKALVKFCQQFVGVQDAWEIERFGYIKARISLKIRILKELLESQFDTHMKFKSEINKIRADELRSQPLGKDKLGHAYWYQCDNNCQIRVYKEDPDEETWTLVAKDRDGLVRLINDLSGNTVLKSESTSSATTTTNEDSNSKSITLDTGQQIESSNSAESSESGELFAKKRSRVDEDCEDGDGDGDDDDEVVEVAKKRAKISEEITEDVVFFKGEGSGEDNQSPNHNRCEESNKNTDKNEDSVVLGEEISEPVMYFSGEGSGADNDTGNDEKSSKNEDTGGNKSPYKLGTILDSKLGNSPGGSGEKLKKISRWDVGKSGGNASKDFPPENSVVKKQLFFFGPGCMKNFQKTEDETPKTISENVKANNNEVIEEKCVKKIAYKCGSEGIQANVEVENEESSVVSETVSETFEKVDLGENIDSTKSEKLNPTENSARCVSDSITEIQKSKESEEKGKNEEIRNEHSTKSDSVNLTNISKEIDNGSTEECDGKMEVGTEDISQIVNEDLIQNEKFEEKSLENIQEKDKTSVDPEPTINDHISPNEGISDKLEHEESEESSMNMNENIEENEESSMNMNEIIEENSVCEKTGQVSMDISTEERNQAEEIDESIEEKNETENIESVEEKVESVNNEEIYKTEMEISIEEKQLEINDPIKDKDELETGKSIEENKPEIDVSIEENQHLGSNEEKIESEIEKSIEEIDPPIEEENDLRIDDPIEEENEPEIAQSILNNESEIKEPIEEKHSINLNESSKSEDSPLNEQSDEGKMEIENENSNSLHEGGVTSEESIDNIDNFKANEEPLDISEEKEDNISGKMIEANTINKEIEKSEDQSNEPGILSIEEDISDAAILESIKDHEEKSITSDDIQIQSEKSIESTQIEQTPIVLENEEKMEIDETVSEQTENAHINEEIEKNLPEVVGTTIENEAIGENVPEPTETVIKNDEIEPDTEDEDMEEKSVFSEDVELESNEIESEQQPAEIVNKSSNDEEVCEKMATNEEITEDTKEIEIVKNENLVEENSGDGSEETSTEDRITNEETIDRICVNEEIEDMSLKKIENEDRIIQEADDHKNEDSKIHAVNLVNEDNTEKLDIESESRNEEINEESSLASSELDSQRVENDELNNADESDIEIDSGSNSKEAVEMVIGKNAEFENDKISNDPFGEIGTIKDQSEETSESCKEQDDSKNEDTMQCAEISNKSTSESAASESEEKGLDLRKMQTTENENDNKIVEDNCDVSDETEKISESIAKENESSIHEQLFSNKEIGQSMEIEENSEPNLIEEESEGNSSDSDTIDKLEINESLLNSEEKFLEYSDKDKDPLIIEMPQLEKENEDIPSQAEDIPEEKDSDSQDNDIVDIEDDEMDIETEESSEKSLIENKNIEDMINDDGIEENLPENLTIESLSLEKDPIDIDQEQIQNSQVEIEEKSSLQLLNTNSTNLVEKIKETGREALVQDSETTELDESSEESTCDKIKIEEKITNPVNIVLNNEENSNKEDVPENSKNENLQNVNSTNLVHIKPESLAKNEENSPASDHNDNDDDDYHVNQNDDNFSPDPTSDMEVEENNEESKVGQTTLLNFSMDFEEKIDELQIVPPPKLPLSGTEESSTAATVKKRGKKRSKKQNTKSRQNVENKRKSNENTSSGVEEDEEGTGTEKKETTEENEKKKMPKKSSNRMLACLGITEDQRKQAIEDNFAASVNTVRQSRRIAQLKIKEEAERRKIEDAISVLREDSPPLSQKKKKSKKNEDKDYKTAVTEETDEIPESGTKKKKKKKRKMLDPRKLFDEYNPWRSSSDSSTSEEIEEDEEEVVDEDYVRHELKSDHEFSPESDIENEESAAPLKRARTVRKESDESKEEEIDDFPCQKCLKHDHPEWILLCDRCDNGWHCSCLRPPLLVIPEGDWFCPPCQHITLMEALQEKLQEFDRRLSKREMEERRRERLAYVGISLNNVLPQQTGEKRRNRENANEDKDSNEEEDEEEDEENDEESSVDESAKKGDNDESEDSDESDEESEDQSEGRSEEVEDEEEPIYQLRQRRQAHSYRFNDYDDLINSAIQDEIEAVKGETGGDAIPAIVAKEEPSIAKPENDSGQSEENRHIDEVPKEEQRPEYSDDDDVIAPVKKRLVQRKKHRKLNALDVSSDEDGDSDEDFKGSPSDSDEFDEDLASEESEDYDLGATKRGGRQSKYGGGRPVRKSGRARTSRYDADFIDDGDPDDEDYVDEEETRKKKRKKRKNRIWSDEDSDDNSEESDDDENDSDRSWGRRRKRTPKRPTPVQRKRKATPSAAANKTATPRKRKRKSAQDSDDPEVYKKKKVTVEPALTNSFEEESTRRRTRGKKINYIDALGSDSDAEETAKMKKIFLGNLQKDKKRDPPAPQPAVLPLKVVAAKDNVDEEEEKLQIDETETDNNNKKKSVILDAPILEKPSQYTIDAINKNFEETIDEKMMETEEYANQQLQFVAMELEREKKRKIEAIAKVEETSAPPIKVAKKRGRKPKPKPQQLDQGNENTLGGASANIGHSNIEIAAPPMPFSVATTAQQMSPSVITRMLQSNSPKAQTPTPPPPQPLPSPTQQQYTHNIRAKQFAAIASTNSPTPSPPPHSPHHNLPPLHPLHLSPSSQIQPSPLYASVIQQGPPAPHAISPSPQPPVQLSVTTSSVSKVPQFRTIDATSSSGGLITDLNSLQQSGGGSKISSPPPPPQPPSAAAVALSNSTVSPQQIFQQRHSLPPQAPSTPPPPSQQSPLPPPQATLLQNHPRLSSVGVVRAAHLMTHPRGYPPPPPAPHHLQYSPYHHHPSVPPPHHHPHHHHLPPHHPHPHHHPHLHPQQQQQQHMTSVPFLSAATPPPPPLQPTHPEFGGGGGGSDAGGGGSFDSDDQNTDGGITISSTVVGGSDQMLSSTSGSASKLANYDENSNGGSSGGGGGGGGGGSGGGAGEFGGLVSYFSSQREDDDLES